MNLADDAGLAGSGHHARHKQSRVAAVTTSARFRSRWREPSDIFHYTLTIALTILDAVWKEGEGGGGEFTIRFTFLVIKLEVVRNRPLSLCFSLSSGKWEEDFYYFLNIALTILIIKWEMAEELHNSLTIIDAEKLIFISLSRFHLIWCSGNVEAIIRSIYCWSLVDLRSYVDPKARINVQRQQIFKKTLHMIN